MKMVFLAAAKLCLESCRYAKDEATRLALVRFARQWISKAKEVVA